MEKLQIRVVRVKEASIERIFNTVLELLMTKNRILEQIALRQHSPEVLRVLSEAEHILSLFYSNIARLRLTPLNVLFRKLKIYAIDLARQLGKKVDVVINDKGLLIDRKIADELLDPLNHIIRNAVDHGIEYPEERIKLGKPLTGTIKLSSARHGSYIRISIEDDGRGIDPLKVVRKAIERGLLPPNTDPHSLKWEDIVKILTTPGFSTKEKVSNISGRGVGLDVVKERVESIGGIFSIESRLGKGTKITLLIPFSASMIKCLIVSITGTLYGIPIAFIRRVSKLQGSEVSDTILYNNEVIPVVEIGRNINGDGDSKYLVFLETSNGLKALRVDNILGDRNLIVRPIPKFVKTIYRFISGLSVFRDNNIVFIIDPYNL